MLDIYGIYWYNNAMFIFTTIIIYLFVFAIGAVAGSFLLVSLSRHLYLRDIYHSCRTPIVSHYVIVGIASGLSAVLSWTMFMLPVGFLFFSVLLCLILIAWIDIKTMEIPDSLNIAIAVCGVIAIFIGPDIDLKSHLIGLAIAAVPLFLIALFVDGAFGFGDVKLMAAAGLFLGWQSTLVALFTGIIIGGVVGAVLLLTKRKSRTDHFAFGPSLCIGIGIAMFAGTKLYNIFLGSS